MHFAEVAILIRSGVGTRVATNTSFGGVPSQLVSRLDPEAEHAKDQSRRSLESMTIRWDAQTADSATWRAKEDLHAQRTKGEESGAGDR